jgi:hypothetical protein
MPRRLFKRLEQNKAEKQSLAAAKKTLCLRFCHSPVALLGDDDDGGGGGGGGSERARLGAVVFDRMRLRGDAGRQRAVPLRELEQQGGDDGDDDDDDDDAAPQRTVPAQLLLRSVGYHGQPLCPDLPWGERAVASFLVAVLTEILPMCLLFLSRNIEERNGLGQTRAVGCCRPTPQVGSSRTMAVVMGKKGYRCTASTRRAGCGAARAA